MEVDAYLYSRCKNMENLFGKCQTLVNKKHFKLIEDFDLKEIVNEKQRKLTHGMNLKKTICAIFERKERHNSMLIEELLKERLFMNAGHTYMLNMDGSDQMGGGNGLVENIKIISRSQEKWAMLKDSVFILNQKIEINYLNEIKIFDLLNPDLIILVLNKIEELDDRGIQLFITRVGKEYTERNFILVIRGVKPENSIWTYPTNKKDFFKRTGLLLDDRVFFLPNQNNTKQNSVKPEFQRIREAIEEELDIKRIAESLDEMVETVFDTVNIIHHSFDRNNLKNAIEIYNTTLQDQYPNIKDRIKTWSTDTNRRISQETNINNIGLANEIGGAYKAHRKTLQCLLTKQAESIRSKCEARIVENLVEDLFSKFLNNTRMKNEIENLYLNDTPDLSNQFLSNAIDKGVTLFKDRFKQQAERKADRIQGTLDQLMKDCREYKAILEINLEKEHLQEQMNQNIAHMKSEGIATFTCLEKIVNDKYKKNIYPKYFGSIILEAMPNIRLNISINAFQDKVDSILNSIPPMERNDKFSRLQEEIKVINKYQDQFQKEIETFLGNLNDEEIYIEEEWRPNNFWRLLGYFEPIKKRTSKLVILKSHIKKLKDGLNRIMNQVERKLRDLCVPIKFE